MIAYDKRSPHTAGWSALRRRHAGIGYEFSRVHESRTGSREWWQLPADGALPALPDRPEWL